MATKKFNGATANFASASLGDLRGISRSEKGAKIDVTGAGDSAKSYEAGIPDEEVKVDIVGTTTVGVGDTGALTIVWPDNTNSSISAVVCIDVDGPKGTMDGELTTSFTFAPLGT